MLNHYVSQTLILSAAIVSFSISSSAYGQTVSQDASLKVRLGSQTPVKKRGYLFVNEKYIAPPYDIRQKDGNLVINGESLAVSDESMVDFQRNGSARDRGNGGGLLGNQRPRFAGFGSSRRRGGARTQTPPLGKLKSFISSSAELDVLIVQDNRKPVSLDLTGAGQSLLQVLLGKEDGTTQEFLNRLPDYDRESAYLLADTFQSSDAFTTRANSHLDAINNIQVENQTLAQANLWTDKIGYPLTVAAMVLVVMAFGHLLSNKPTLTQSVMDEFPSSAKSVVGRSLAIVAALSLIDLVWTMAAAQNGTIRELNPLGSKMLDNPTQLFVFKFVATATAIALLYRLKKQPIAQMASWWSCLILTLLTARWLTFNSMFL